MNENPEVAQEILKQHYNYAADLLVNHKYSTEQTQEALIAKGVDAESASTVVSELEEHILIAKKEKAKKDMLYGALWCVGGIIMTVADIGFIFWGAIVFGGIQFFRGALNA